MARTVVAFCLSAKESKNFTESFVIAEIYAQALEAHGFHVDRRFDLGSVQIALAALQHGDIDLYPEYTGTALIDVLHMAPMSDPRKVYETVEREFDYRASDAGYVNPRFFALLASHLVKR